MDKEIIIKIINDCKERQLALEEEIDKLLGLYDNLQDERDDLVDEVDELKEENNKLKEELKTKDEIINKNNEYINNSSIFLKDIEDSIFGDPEILEENKKDIYEITVDRITRDKSFIDTIELLKESKINTLINIAKDELNSQDEIDYLEKSYDSIEEKKELYKDFKEEDLKSEDTKKSQASEEHIENFLLSLEGEGKNEIQLTKEDLIKLLSK